MRKSSMKDWYIAAHEELITEYRDKHPDADEAKVYEATAGAAYGRMSQRYAEYLDAWLDRAKEERL